MTRQLPRPRPFRTAGLLLSLTALLAATCSHASVALLMEEPYGEFGAFNPTGHAAIYLNHVCADTPTHLRPCNPGEPGVVISRYHKIHHEDWIAIPIVPYLYAVDDLTQVPPSIDEAQAVALQDAYWRTHLTQLAPPAKDGGPPKGEWNELVGESYIRKMHGFQMDTTPEQDQHLIAYFNDRRNVGHFNILFHNCADFARVVLGMDFPHAIHRNFIADMGLTTPKQVARSIVKFGNDHPELHMTAFVIPQVPGTIKRSHPVDGVAESLVKSKRYILPLVILQPEVAGAMVVGYLADGRLHLAKNTPIFNIGDEERPDAEAPATPQDPASGRRPLPVDAPSPPATPAPPPALPAPNSPAGI
jgi:hypothetical protein